jgi:hypothetical protein
MASSSSPPLSEPTRWIDDPASCDNTISRAFRACIRRLRAAVKSRINLAAASERTGFPWLPMYQIIRA